MKNLYFLLLLALTSINLSLAQDLQNRNWYFGQGVGLNFSTFNPTTSVLPYPLNANGDFYHNVTCHTTVSDVNGNLLYFSDGRSIFQYWNGAYHTIATLLPDNNAYHENRIVSVPRPGHPSKYFIVSLNNHLLSGSNSGLLYAQIDMGGGLAQMLNLNVPLKDSNNTLITSAYQITSSALTSTVHADGDNYWIIAHVRKQGYSQLLSYMVTSSGIQTTPSASVVIPNFQSQDLKVSPDTKKIAITSETGVFVGDFNNSTGEIVMYPNAIGSSSNPINTTNYGLEFSQNSNYLYYSDFLTLKAIDVSNTSNPINETFLGNGFFDGMQLAINGKIYIGNQNWTSSVINNPDNMASPNLSYKSVAYSSAKATISVVSSIAMVGAVPEL